MGFGSWPAAVKGWAITRLGHDSACPALDLPVQADTAANLDPQAAVIVLTGVLTHGGRLVPLEDGPVELRGISAGDLKPESLGAVS